MKTISVDGMRKLDQRTIEDAGVPGEVLMERAGQGLAHAISRMAELAGKSKPRILFVAGKGNNGGDAFVAARHLHQQGCLVELWLAASRKELKGDALLHFKSMEEAGVVGEEVITNDAWIKWADFRPQADIVVDGLLGTGATGAPKGAIAHGIAFINSMRGAALVVAIDVPSGMHADDASTSGDAVRADLTVTMGLAKKGFAAAKALDYVGAVEVIDIGIPGEYVEGVEASDEAIITARDAAVVATPRRRDSHKGTYGHVLLVGGARGYAGAITMAAQAATRSGVGLVSVMTPHGIAATVSGNVLEAMVSGAVENEEGALSSELWQELRGSINDYNAVLLGPGMARNDDTLLLVRQVIRESSVPLVIDADAISVLEGQPHWIQKANCPVVLTPHPGELARLFTQSVDEVQHDRVGMAQAAAKYTDATVVLKGAGTIVAGKDQPPHINMTGNPGMATGGTGDVLAGLLVGLVGQGMDPFEAACGAVYVHGRAGDRVALRTSQQGLTAGDVISEIPAAFGELQRT